MNADDINQRAAEIRAQQLRQARAGQVAASAQARKEEEQRRELQSRIDEIGQLAVNFYRWVMHYGIPTDSLPRYSSWKGMVPSRKVGWHLVVKVIRHPSDGGKMPGYDETSYLVVTTRGELVGVDSSGRIEKDPLLKYPFGIGYSTNVRHTEANLSALATTIEDVRTSIATYVANNPKASWPVP